MWEARYPSTTMALTRVSFLMKKPPDISVQCTPVPRCSLKHHAQHRIMELPSNTTLTGHFGEAYSAQVYWCNISVVGNQIVSVNKNPADVLVDQHDGRYYKSPINIDGTAKSNFLGRRKKSHYCSSLNMYSQFRGIYPHLYIIVGPALLTKLFSIVFYLCYFLLRKVWVRTKDAPYHCLVLVNTVISKYNL